MIYIIKNVKNLKLIFCILTIICILMAGTTVLASNSLAKLTTLFSEHNFDHMNIIFFTLLFFLLDAFVCYIYRIICGRIQAVVYSEIQTKSFYQITHISSDNVLLKNKGDLYSRINNDCTELTDFFASIFPKIITQCIYLILITTYMFIINWQLSAIYLLTLALSIFLQLIFSKVLKKISIQKKQYEVALNTALKDSINNRIVTKTYGKYDFIHDLYTQSEKKYNKTNIMIQFFSAPIHISGLLCGMLPSLAICIAAIFFIPQQIITLSAFMSLFYLCQRLLPDQLHYVDLFMNIVKIQPALNRTIQLWKENVTLQNNSCSCKNDICLKNIYYKYPDSNKWAAKDISLYISAGEKVAFIGKSGCGKSTVLKLISGLLTPQKGNISVPESTLSKQFPSFFSGTIKENILCFKNGDHKKFEKACNTAMLQSFLIGLENGLDYKIDSREQNLSGGQLQRIALARILNTDAPAILLDESISALDAETAESVIKNIIQNYPLTTVVMVLHQLEFLPFMDRIFVFDNGKIIAQGSYQELLNQNVLGKIGGNMYEQ